MIYIAICLCKLNVKFLVELRGGNVFDNKVEQELAVTDESRELAIFKSAYYQLNAKPDSLSRAYPRKVIITRDDIIDLNSRINKKISLNYQDDEYIATVTVYLKDKREFVFKCWEEFVQHEWTESSSISSISLQWNFNVRIPGYDNPQNHNLVVKLTNGLRAEEVLNLIFSGKIEDLDEIELNSIPIIARVDFIQVILGEELLNIVGEWVKGLKQNSQFKNPIIMLMRKYRKNLAQYFEYFSFIMMFILIIGINSYLIGRLDFSTLGDLSLRQFKILLIYLSTSGVILFFFKKFFEYIAQGVYDKLSEYGQIFIFDITKGDMNLQDQIRRKDKEDGKSIVIRFAMSLIFNVGCGIIASFLC